MAISTSKQRGAVALITAIIVSILLMITTAGMVALTVKSVRSSTDGAQSTKAYYAAESGLETAVLKLKRDPTYTGDCPPGGTNSTTSAANGVVTCSIVTANSAAATGSIDVDKTVQLDLSSVSGISSVVVEWTTLGSYDSRRIPSYENAAGASSFPAKGSSSWPATAPGVVQAGLVEYPGSSSFLLDDVKYYQASLAPKSPRSGDPSNSIPQSNLLNLYPYNQFADDGSGALNKPFVTLCNQPAPYQCKAAATGIPGTNHKYLLRLTSRYSGARYRVTVQNSSNTVLTIPNKTFTIDVTARAGDVYRRVRTSFPSSQQGNVALSGLDYVLYSDTNICKSFEVNSSGTFKPLNCQIP